MRLDRFSHPISKNLMLLQGFCRLRQATYRLLCALAICLPNWAFSAESLNVCYESVDVLPWRTADAKGLNFQLLQSVSDKTSVQFNFEGLPWKRCLSGLQAGIFDAAIGASFKQDRLEIGVYPGGNKPDASKRTHTDRYVVVRNKGTQANWDGKTFSGIKGPVGIQLGYSIGDDIRALGMPTDDGSPGARELLQKLISGRVELVSLLEGEARHLIASDRNFTQKLETLPSPLSEKHYYMVFSKQYFALHSDKANQIWQTIAIVRESSQYKQAERRQLDR